MLREQAVPGLHTRSVHGDQPPVPKGSAPCRCWHPCTVLSRTFALPLCGSRVLILLIFLKSPILRTTNTAHCEQIQSRPLPAGTAPPLASPGRYHFFWRSPPPAVIRHPADSSHGRTFTVKKTLLLPLPGNARLAYGAEATAATEAADCCDGNYGDRYCEREQQQPPLTVSAAPETAATLLCQRVTRVTANAAGAVPVAAGALHLRTTAAAADTAAVPATPVSSRPCPVLFLLAFSLSIFICNRALCIC